jgi:uncharacterized protein
VNFLATPRLGNCPKCKKLYLRIRDICDECYQKQEEDFIKVATYLREYPGSTLQVLSDETEVSVAQIRYFILIGRIVAGHFPNLAYPCETCGKMIQTGRSCTTCMTTVHGSLENYQKGKDEQSNDGNTNAGGYITKYL